MTKGKRRGYSLRFEHTAEDGSPIQARFIAPKRFVNAKDWQQFAQECQRARLTSKEEKSAEEDN
jgi:hypothetical protein